MFGQFGTVISFLRLGMLLSICIIFTEFQPSVAYKSVAYKKVRYNNQDETVQELIHLVSSVLKGNNLLRCLMMPTNVVRK